MDSETKVLAHNLERLSENVTLMLQTLGTQQKTMAALSTQIEWLNTKVSDAVLFAEDAKHEANLNSRKIENIERRLP